MKPCAVQTTPNETPRTDDQHKQNTVRGPCSLAISSLEVRSYGRSCSRPTPCSLKFHAKSDEEVEVNMLETVRG